MEISLFCLLLLIHAIKRWIVRITEYSFNFQSLNLNITQHQNNYTYKMMCLWPGLRVFHEKVNKKLLKSMIIFTKSAKNIINLPINLLFWNQQSLEQWMLLRNVFNITCFIWLQSSNSRIRCLFLHFYASLLKHVWLNHGNSVKIAD